jgi:WD40 repeat protein
VAHLAVDVFYCHPIFGQSITFQFVACAGVSPDGNHLLTNSMDNTLRVWDVRPYATANRCTKVNLVIDQLDRCVWSFSLAQLAALVSCLPGWNINTLQVFTGHQHTFEKNLLKCDWSADGNKVGGWICPSAVQQAGLCRERQCCWM